MFCLADKTEDLGPGGSLSDYSKGLFWRGKGGTIWELLQQDQIVSTSKDYC